MFSLWNVLEYRKNPIVFVNRVGRSDRQANARRLFSGSGLLVLHTFEMIRKRLSLGL